MDLEITFKHDPCLKCGGTLWYSSSRRCAGCTKARAEKARLANPEAAAKRNKEWKLANKERNRELAKLEYHRNGRPRISKWKKENKGKVNAQTNIRRAKKLQASPEWLSKEDKRTIEGFYIMAQRLSDCTGIPHHVDHIHPLNGRMSRGLHVPWNLQVIPAQLNMSKGNKLEAQYGNYFEA
jgi:hypothetical protein